MDERVQIDVDFSNRVVGRVDVVVHKADLQRLILKLSVVDLIKFHDILMKAEKLLAKMSASSVKYIIDHFSEQSKILQINEIKNTHLCDFLIPCLKSV